MVGHAGQATGQEISACELETGQETPCSLWTGNRPGNTSLWTETPWRFWTGNRTGNRTGNTSLWTETPWSFWTGNRTGNTSLWTGNRTGNTRCGQEVGQETPACGEGIGQETPACGQEISSHWPTTCMEENSAEANGQAALCEGCQHMGPPWGERLLKPGLERRDLTRTCQKKKHKNLRRRS